MHNNANKALEMLLNQRFRGFFVSILIRKYIIGIRVNMNSMLKATTNHSCKSDGHGQMSCIIILENHIREKNA